MAMFSLMSKMMSKMSRFRVLLILTLTTFAVMPAGAQQTEIHRVQDAQDVFQVLAAVPEHDVPAALIRQVQGIAIIPNVQRVGFIIGGQHGRGVLVARGADGSWSRPLFLTLAGGSVGFQIGIQSADIVLFFRTKDSVDRVLRGKYTIGVDASLAAGSLGRDAAAVTDQDLRAEIYSYSRTRGIFAGVAIQGASLEVDYDANALYYGKEISKPVDVLEGIGLPNPPTAVQLSQALAACIASLK
jgi:lipid-binding SYLF domain-containing protein